MQARDKTEFWWSLNPRVRNVGFYDAAPGYRYRPADPRVRDFYVWYVAGGAGSLCIDGRWTRFREGEILTLLPGQLYQDERADADVGSRIYFSHVLPLGRDSRSEHRRLARGWPTRVACPHPSRMRDLFAELLELLTLRPEQYPLRAKAIVLEVLGVLLAPAASRDAAGSEESRRKVSQAQRFIEENHADRLTPERVAAGVDLSESYLFALFQRHIRQSPMQYLWGVRLRKAAILLSQGTSVSEAADRVGFESLHYFSRSFKRKYGQAPSRFAIRFRTK